MILGNSADGMERPRKIDDDLYFEVHSGTETMLILLMKIFRFVDFDTSDILVSVIDK